MDLFACARGNKFAYQVAYLKSKNGIQVLTCVDRKWMTLLCT